MAAKKKRNPNGSGTISLREDGRYELKVFVDTPDGRRKRISVYGSTWEEADAERTRVKELQRKAIPVESTTTTVADDELMTILGSIVESSSPTRLLHGATRLDWCSRPRTAHHLNRGTSIVLSNRFADAPAYARSGCTTYATRARCFCSRWVLMLRPCSASCGTAQFQ